MRTQKILSSPALIFTFGRWDKKSFILLYLYSLKIIPTLSVAMNVSITDITQEKNNYIYYRYTIANRDNL